MNGFRCSYVSSNINCYRCNYDINDYKCEYVSLYINGYRYGCGIEKFTLQQHDLSFIPTVCYHNFGPSEGNLMYGNCRKPFLFSGVSLIQRLGAGLKLLFGLSVPSKHLGQVSNLKITPEEKKMLHYM